MMNVLDLFSGIGGFSLGLESTGFFKTIAFVEKDRFCQKVLQKNFPGVPIEDEIRNVRGSRYQADVVTGGFPCQPFSVAGKRKGTDDDRYLWDEMLRVITEVKARWIVGENVAGIINIENGKVLQQIQKDLESEGFQVQCLIIPASGVGAWHQRKRVWIIANSKSKGTRSNNSRLWQRSGRIGGRKSSDVSNSKSKRSFSTSQSKPGVDEQQRLDNDKKKIRSEIRSDSSRCSEQNTSSNVPNSDNNGSHRPKRNATIKSGNEPKDRLSIGNDKDVSNSDSRLRGRRTAIGESGENEIRRIYSKKEEQARNDIRSKTVGCDAVSKQTESWWEAQSELCGVPHGISYGLDKDRANRIKALGNSIVPQIAFEIGRAIIRAEEQQT